MQQRILFGTVLLASHVSAAEPFLGFGKDSAPVIETRTLDQLHQAALAEGGVVTLWHGGDEKNQQDSLKSSFETRFPGMTLNVTVDLSKYHDVNIDAQLAANNVYVDSVILQTVNDYPRWAAEDVLLRYAPAGFDKVHGSFKDVSAAWYGAYIFNWNTYWNLDTLKADGPVEWTDWLRPELKDKIVCTYPNDDDAVLYAFDLIMQQYGPQWFDKFVTQNIRWVRGTQTPFTIVSQKNSTYAASFIGGPLASSSNINVSFPQQGQFVSWPQTAAILKAAPHPEGAKLLHNFILSKDYQSTMGLWPVRTDIPGPAGLPAIYDMPGTNPDGFVRWMADRGRVERLRNWFESRIGSAQGLSPLIDDL
ncbi:uncharacterized protein PG998_000066 [Apiospora kogelbergensis]|uniref:uncharacterized protein n=1 Tax=Apiospora kogelbergensis TaxID=1337665 RepID=UPI0031322828